MPSEDYSRWPAYYSPLNRTIGYSALMRLLDPIVRKGMGQNPPTLESKFFESEFKKAAHLAPFTFEEYPRSGGGETKIYNALTAAIFTGAAD